MVRYTVGRDTENNSPRSESPIGWSEWFVYLRSWWKPVVAGAVLILFVIAGSGIGVDAWFLGFFAVILAVSLMAVGLAMGLAHLVSLHRSGARA